MAKTPYRTAPDPHEKGWPGGIPYIIGNEVAERFSFYGMRSILVPYLTTLYVAHAIAPELAGRQASADAHLFNAAVYALPMVGAILADKLLGKYRTIMLLSLAYCAGHAVLAFAEGSIPLMHGGLALVAIGSGGIKPCVSSNVGDQFGEGNWPLTKKVFQIFYFGVNFGSFFSTLLIPFLLDRVGPSIAFGLPGVLMFIATFIFWMGRHKLVHVPGRPAGKLGALDAASGTLLFVGILGGWMFGPKFGLTGQPLIIVSVASTLAGLSLFAYRLRLQPDDGFLAVLFTSIMQGSRAARQKVGDESFDGMKAVFRVVSVIVFVIFFFALFDQHGTTWLLQADKMNLVFDLPLLGKFTMLPAQTAAANPLLVLMLIPLFILVVFPGLERAGLKITPLRRMGAGMLLTALSFVATAMVQAAIDDGQMVHVAWQLPQYVLLTIGEVLVSATGLEFCYSQAPRRMKATLMGFWYLTSSFGNVFAAATIAKMQDRPLNEFFWICAAAMAVVSLAFIARSYFYTYRDYAQK